MNPRNLTASARGNAVSSLFLLLLLASLCTAAHAQNDLEQDYKTPYFEKNYEEASKAVERAIERAVSGRASQLKIGWLLRDKGEISRAASNLSESAKAYQEAIAKAGGGTDQASIEAVALFRVELAEVFRLEGRYSDAAQQLEQGRRNMPRVGSSILSSIEGLAPISTGDVLAARVSGHMVDFWGDGDTMLPRYGRYTVVLLGADQMRNAAFVEHLLRVSFVKTDDRVRDGSEWLGIFYFPVKQGTQGNARVQLARGDRGAAAIGPLLIRYYDFERAAPLYASLCKSPLAAESQICRQPLTRGPILISTTYRSHAGFSDTDPTLLVDLSSVNPSAFEPLIDEVLRKIVQQEFSSVGLLDQIRLKVLDVLTSAASAAEKATKPVAGLAEIFVAK